MKQLGVESHPWKVQAIGEEGAVLTGNITADFEKGYATFKGVIVKRIILYFIIGMKI